MTAIVWAMFGLMAASLGVLATALFSQIARIDALRIEFVGRFDRLDDKIAGLDRRLTAAGG